MDELQNGTAELLSALLVDQSSVVKRSVLLDIAPLCIFFGKQKTNDVLLSHMITYLNDRDWLLRSCAFIRPVFSGVANLPSFAPSLHLHIRSSISLSSTAALHGSHPTIVGSMLISTFITLTSSAPLLILSGAWHRIISYEFPYWII